MFYLILIGKVRPKIQTLLDSLTELSKLLYLPAQSRSPKLVLRLHNQAFIHAMICKDVIGKPKSLTSRKFHGRYWRSLTAHAGKQSRIISAKSTNTEEEERHFNTLQGVTRLTSRRPGDIITPSLIRLQAEQKLAESKQGNAVKVQESQISKYYSTLPPFPNTTVPNRYIINNAKSTKPIYKPSVTSLPVAKVSGGVRSCLEWNSWMALMSQILDLRDQSFTTSDQVISEKKKHTFNSAGRDA